MKLNRINTSFLVLVIKLTHSFQSGIECLSYLISKWLDDGNKSMVD